MTIERLNPPQLARPSGFVHVTACTAERLVFVAGQVAYETDGTIVGAGDFAAQTHQVMKNLQHALAATGATFRDVVKLTFFVKGMDEAAIRAIRAARTHYLPDDALPASTMVGVAALARPELLLEVEAYAVVGRG